MRAERISKICQIFEDRLKTNKGAKKAKIDVENEENALASALNELFEEDPSPGDAYLELYCTAATLKGHAYLYKIATQVYEEFVKKEKTRGDVGKDLQNKAFNVLLETESIKGKREDRKIVKSFQHFVKIFKFDQLDKPLEQHLKKFISDAEYACAGSLLAYGPAKLVDRWPNIFDGIIIPMFIIKQAEEVPLYDKIIRKLARRSKNELRLVTFLDDYLAKGNDSRKNVVARYVGMPKDGYKGLCNLKKSVKEYAAEFGFQKTDFPNYMTAEALGELNYLFRLYLGKAEKGKTPLTEEQFEDHVRNAMLHNDAVAQKFIESLRAGREYRKWKEFSEKPQTLKQEYLAPYQLDGFTVEYVRTDTAKDIEAVTDVLKNLKKGTVVTMDCENRPTYATPEKRVALLQFAFNTKAYVVDTLSLGTKPEFDTAWKCFFDEFFSHRIFGLGLNGDISYLESTYSALKDIPKKDVVKTEKFIPHLKKDFPNNEFFQSLDPYCGLRELHKKCCPSEPEMDKSEQRSCFDRRPLRRSQLDYAARDVIVLVKIYAKLKEFSEREANGAELFEKSTKAQ